MRRFASVAVLAFLLAGGGAALAEDEEPSEPPPIPNLEKHPLTDAKAGEYLRFVETSKDGKWKQWYEERVLAVKDGEVFLEVMSVNEQGKELGAKQGVVPAWLKVPELKPREFAKFKTDEMLVLEIGGKKLNCRHLVIEEPKIEGFMDPRQIREVWYTNEALATGKVKEVRPDAIRTASSWGELSKEVLDARRKVFEKEIGAK
jgi:hypothetical protein